MILARGQDEGDAVLHGELLQEALENPVIVVAEETVQQIEGRIGCFRRERLTFKFNRVERDDDSNRIIALQAAGIQVKLNGCHTIPSVFCTVAET